jgi:prepilin-type N-terminal cleavage/methylation domain-containing protein
MTKKSASGFTIVELLIATAVFAVVLVIAQASFLQIGHLFYRGISITNTQESADHIFQDINGNLQSASTIEGAKNSSTGGYDYYCIGNTRYTYRIDNEVNSGGTTDHSATGNFGILKDTMKGAGTECPAPCDDAGGACPSGAPLKDPVEMLGDKMRVEQFDITQSTTTSNLYNVAIVIAYGENSTLTYGTPGNYSTAECQGDLNNSFCAVSRINTSIYKGLHQ